MAKIETAKGVSKTVKMNASSQEQENKENAKLSYEQLEQIAQQQHQQMMQMRQQLMAQNMESISFKFGISLEILKLGDIVFSQDFIYKVASDVEGMYHEIFEDSPTVTEASQKEDASK